MESNTFQAGWGENGPPTCECVFSGSSIIQICHLESKIYRVSLTDQYQTDQNAYRYFAEPHNVTQQHSVMFHPINELMQHYNVNASINIITQSNHAAAVMLGLRHHLAQGDFVDVTFMRVVMNNAN